MSAPTSALPNDDAVLATLREAVGDRAVRVLDLGGGTGGYAVPLACHGHTVEVLDHSNDALATLARRAQAEGVGDRVAGRVADLDHLAESVRERSADLVLCHRVLEFVDSPVQTMRAAASTLADGGMLSVVAANRAGAALSRVIAGRFDEAEAALDGAHTAQTGHRFDAAELTGMLQEAGLAVRRLRGVGLIGELNPSEAGTAAARALGERLAADPVLAQVAPLLHLIAVRDEHGA